MKQISEMTLEELRDHALDLTQKNAAATQRETELTKQINDLNELNKTLQVRNNDLFMKVEQQTVAATAPAETKEDSVESCEDFARRMVEGV